MLLITEAYGTTRDAPNHLTHPSHETQTNRNLCPMIQTRVPRLKKIESQISNLKSALPPTIPIPVTHHHLQKRERTHPKTRNFDEPTAGACHLTGTPASCRKSNNAILDSRMLLFPLLIIISNSLHVSIEF